MNLNERIKENTWMYLDMNVHTGIKNLMYIFLKISVYISRLNKEICSLQTKIIIAIYHISTENYNSSKQNNEQGILKQTVSCYPATFKLGVILFIYFSKVHTGQSSAVRIQNVIGWK